MISIGERIREERSRLGFNQDRFSTIASVQRRTQSNYERNERAPDANYLSRIAAHGADVGYIITGHRTLTPADVEQAAQRMADTWEALERALLQHPRTLTPAQKRQAAETLYQVRQTQPADQSEQILELVLRLTA